MAYLLVIRQLMGCQVTMLQFQISGEFWGVGGLAGRGSNLPS